MIVEPSAKDIWVAVMGSGQVDAQHEVYRIAYACGKELAEAGFGLITGGYGGVMEASSRGAHEAHGRVRSVPCREFGRNGIHPYADEVFWTPRYEDRIRTLMALAHAYLFLLGGIGTLAELFYAWSAAQVRSPRHKPLALVGPGWPELLPGWQRTLLIAHDDWERLPWFPQPGDAVRWLRSHFSRSASADHETEQRP